MATTLGYDARPQSDAPVRDVGANGNEILAEEDFLHVAKGIRPANGAAKLSRRTRPWSRESGRPPPVLDGHRPGYLGNTLFGHH